MYGLRVTCAKVAQTCFICLIFARRTLIFIESLPCSISTILRSLKSDVRGFLLKTPKFHVLQHIFVKRLIIAKMG